MADRPSRRDFMKRGSSLALAAGLGTIQTASASPSEPVREFRRGGMLYRRLGRADLFVSVLAYGSHTDPAFKRPGRIDLVLQLDPPAADLRRRLLDRWHPDIRAGIDLDGAVAATDGWSFAEIDEMKSLLILIYLDTGTWDWDAARAQWETNRHDLDGHRR